MLHTGVGPRAARGNMVPCVKNPELSNIFPPKPEVGQHNYSHACFARYRKVFLTSFYFPGPLNFICSKASPPHQAWLKQVPVWARLLKKYLRSASQAVVLRFPCWVPAECRQTPKHVLLCNRFQRLSEALQPKNSGRHWRKWPAGKADSEIGLPVEF